MNREYMLKGEEIEIVRLVMEMYIYIYRHEREEVNDKKKKMVV